MRQKTSCFNARLFSHTVLRFWPLWAVYMVLWLLWLAGLARNLTSLPDFYVDTTQYLTASLPSSTVYLGLAGSFFMAPMVAMAVFSHLYNIRSAGAIASLPLRRESVFLTQTLAGLLPLWAVDLIALLLGMAALGGSGWLSTALPWLAQSFAVVMLYNLIFLGIAVLCAQMAGHILALPAAYFMLSFAAVVVETIVREILGELLFGLCNKGAYLFEFLSPVIFLTSMRFNGVWDAADNWLPRGFSGWGPVFFYAMAALGCLLLSLLLYRRRRMESAGDVVAFRVLRPIFKYCFALGCALVIFAILRLFFFVTATGGRALPATLLSLLFGGTLGYIAAEMLICKSFRIRRKSWIGLAVMMVLLLGGVSALSQNVTGFETRLPRREEVASVELQTGYSSNYGVFREPGSIQEVLSLHESIVADRDYYKNEWPDRSRVGASEEAWGYTLELDYLDEEGRLLMTRQYELPWDALGLQAQELLNTREGVLSRMPDTGAEGRQLSGGDLYWCSGESDEWESTNLSAGEADELFTQCVLPDAEEGKLGQILIVSDEEGQRDYLACELNFFFEWEAPEEAASDYFCLTLRPEAERTIAWLHEHGVDPVPYGEVPESAGIG